jgi:hypothetical protein
MNRHIDVEKTQLFMNKDTLLEKKKLFVRINKILINKLYGLGLIHIDSLDPLA